MKIGFDLTPIIYGRGVSRYTSNLVTALNAQSKTHLLGLGYSWRKKSLLQNFVNEHPLSGFTLLSIPPSIMKFAWRWGRKPVKELLGEVDVFHSWDWLQPPDKDIPLVSTIHDVAMLKFPETAHPKILKAHQRSWEILKKREARIIAPSQATKKDILNLLGIPGYQVDVIHEALPQEFKNMSQSISEDEAQAIKTKLRLTKPYLLFVGTREPRKNLLRLIKAWKPLAKDYQLIIAGEKGWDESHTLKHPELRFLGPVNDKELAVLYGEAEVFCYPSLYEGFGLPILEAFFHGTPVLTSDVSSMPEVAGNAAVLVNPQSVGEITKGLEKILGEKLPEQQKRLQRMIIRLQMFDWNQIAQETLSTYSKAIQAKE